MFVVFKQKTAYEMRISDWSSDVCSSDLQPAELGWGTHEKWMPDNARGFDYGSRSAIYLLQPGANTRVRSWTPTAQAQYGFLVTHNEAVSIADYYTVREDEQTVYRPTCHYAYHPADVAVLSLHAMFGRGGQAPTLHKILDENEIVDGADELGVLIFGDRKSTRLNSSH